MQLRGPSLVLETVSARAPVISIENTAYTLNQNQSGSTVKFDRAAGNTVTLPTSPVPGTWYDFQVENAPTSNSHKVLTSIASGTAILIGGVILTNVNDNTMKAFQGAKTDSFVSVKMNGTTTGGQPGTRFRVSAIASGTWCVTGIVFGSGAIATPFSATQ